MIPQRFELRCGGTWLGRVPSIASLGFTNALPANLQTKLNVMAEPIRIAGVPEAFNDCFQHADFAGKNVPCSAKLVLHPGGSGSMLNSVKGGQVDAAFALTDCIVAAIENGDPVRLAAPLVRSPLTWAVIVAGKGSITSLDELSDATWGISRVGSGSHVMVQTLASKRGWTAEPRFKVCGNFQGLRDAVNDGTVDAFLWEHFTTRPFEDKGDVRIIDGVPTPWGCFSVVVSEDCKRIHDIHAVVDAFLEAGKQFLEDPGNVGVISLKYGMSEDDAKGWMRGVRYATSGERFVPQEELGMTREILRKAGVIKKSQFEGGTDFYYTLA